MNTDETKNIMRVLAAAYSHVITDDEIMLWQNVFSQTPYDGCQAAAEQWVLTSKWWPTPHDFKETFRAVRAEKAKATPNKVGHVKCEGFGWVTFGGRDMPCTSCNPALAEVYYDDEKAQLLADGYAIHEALGITKEELQDRYGGRPRCIRSRYDDPTVSPTRGKEIARLAYVAHCSEQGVEPNMRHFNKSLGIKS
jgi:hypothetical protein